MTFSFTGLSYLVGSIVLFFLAIRFFRYWMQERSLAGRMLFFFVLFLLAFFAVTAVLSLFFAHSAFALKLAVVEAVVFQGIAISFLGYLLLRLKVPSASPFWGPLCIFLISGTSTILAILLPYTPRLDEAGLVIQWNVPLIINIPSLLIFSLTFLPLAWVFFQEYRMTKEPRAKDRALGFAAVMAIGFLAGSFDFLFEQILGLGEALSDIFLVVTFGVLLVVVLFPSWFQRKEVI